MKQFSKPYWLYLTVSLPLLLILLYFAGVYGIIESLLKPDHLTYWVRFAVVLGVLVVVTTAYGVFLQVRHQLVSWIYSLLALPLYIVLLVFYFRSLDMLLPSGIPGWMVPIDELVVLPVGLVMPVLLHCLLLQVDHLTPVDKNPSLKMTAIGAILVPACWYVQMRLIVPALQGKSSWAFYQNMQLTVFIVLTVIFIFLLMRLMYLLTLKGLWEKPRVAIAIKTIFVLILPLLSLLAYNGVVAGILGNYSVSFQFLGDWSHPGYYAVIIVNGLLLMLPPVKKDLARLVIFIAKVLLFPFVVYFFIVLLPFLPIAVDVVIVGLGFLLLSPLILFYFHTRSLVEDWKSFRSCYDPKITALAFAVAFMLLPTGLTVSYLMDRHALNTMLAHVYEPDYSARQLLDIDKQASRRVLDNIKKVKSNRALIFHKRKPYLTTYYQWLVLDNLTLSEKRLTHLERIFFDSSDISTRSGNRPSPEERAPRLTDVKVNTILSEDGLYYKSQIDLILVNNGVNNAEYATKFRLPVGAWVSDYYLVINGEKVPGILSEKKSAMWIYQQSRDYRRDPGIIYYTSPDEIILRVFPFAADETRYTGFEIIHREPLDFEIDDMKAVQQGQLPALKLVADQSGQNNYTIVSAAEKSSLSKSRRTPYWHFIVDRSSRSAQLLEDYIQVIERMLSRSPIAGISGKDARITIANHDSQTYGSDTNWQALLRNTQASGGFFLQHAFKKSLFSHYQQAANRYPVFVVVSDHFDNAIFTTGMRDFEITMPEGNRFFVVNGKQHLSTRRFSSPFEEPSGERALSLVRQEVLLWPDAQQPLAYLPDNGRASLVIRNPDPDISSLVIEGSKWEKGVSLYGMWMSSVLNPTQSGSKQKFVIQNSFQTHLLTPLTAFLSPENDAQRQMLLKKQQRMLASMRHLDIGEEHQMDEPPLWVLIGFLVLFLLLGKRRRLAMGCLKRYREHIQ